MSAKVIQRPVQQPAASRKPPCLLSYEDLKARGIKFSRQWILQLMKEGKFPKTVAVGAGHSVGFIESEIDAWIENLIAERDDSGFTNRLDNLKETRNAKANTKAG